MVFKVGTDILIRSETPADEAGIRDVTMRAFAGLPYAEGTEQDIIDALRIRNALSVSLVADRGGMILGHVAFSPASPPPGGIEEHFMVLCFGGPAPDCVINFHDAFVDPKPG